MFYFYITLMWGFSHLFFLGLLLTYSVQAYTILSKIFFYHFEVTHIGNDSLAEFVLSLKDFSPVFWV